MSEIILEGGTNNSKIIIKNGKKFVRKIILETSKNTPSIIKRRLRETDKFLLELFYKTPENFLRKIPKNNREYIKKEIETLTMWKKEEIIDLEVISSKNDFEIYLEYIESKTYLNLLKANNLTEKKLEKLSEKYQSIRELALTKNDPMCFHSDPHLENFLYSEKKKCVPIDPGIILNKEKKIRNLDTNLNLFFLFSFFKSKKNKNLEDMINGVIKNFSKNDRENMKKIITTYRINTNYINFRETIVSKIKGRKFNPELIYTQNNIELIKNLL
jgi:hypothetical protein